MNQCFRQRLLLEVFITILLLALAQSVILRALAPASPNLRSRHQEVYIAYIRSIEDLRDSAVLEDFGRAAGGGRVSSRRALTPAVGQAASGRRMVGGRAASVETTPFIELDL